MEETALVAVRGAFERVAEAERELQAARKARAAALAAAREGGVSLAAIGRELGLSRQRIAAMISAGNR